jgi:microcompartment protein CcmL/EutN
MAALGIIEISNITKGYLICDGILKLAPVTVFSAQPVCPGKVVLIFGGLVSAVSHACEYARGNFSEYILDISEFGNIDARVFDALNGVIENENQGSLGIIETYSAAACILAADTALKAANVGIADLRLARGMGGKSLLTLTGSISAVVSATEAGANYAKENGLLTDTAVIPAPHEALWDLINS